MKMAWKSMLCCLMVVSLLLPMAACSQQKPDAEDGNSAASQNEVVTLRMFIRNQSKYAGLQNDPVAKYVEDHLGVRIELTVDVSLGNTSAQTSTFNELLASKLASNDLDDIMDFGSPTGNPDILSNLQRAAESGIIIPLDDLIAKHATSINSDPRLAIRNEYRKAHMYDDGKIYSIGAWGGMGLDQLPGSANWVRWDAYKAMGYPEITTDDAFLEMLKEMQALYPTTPSGDKIYGFGGSFADPQGMGDGFINRDYPMTKGYEPLEGNYAVYINHATQEVDAPLKNPDSYFWNGVEFYYKANQMGLLDPSATMMSKSEYDEKFNKGVYLANLNGWGAVGKEVLMEAAGIPNSGYMPVKPLDDVVSLPMYWESVLGIDEFVITNKCKYPEKAIKFLDWCMSEEGSRILTQGVEGHAWEYVNGVPTSTENYRQDNNAGNVDMAEVYGKWKYAGINAFQHIDLDSKGNYIMPEQMPNKEHYSVVKKDALQYYGTDTFTNYWTNYVSRSGKKIPCVIWGSYPGGIGPKPDDIKAKYSQINDYMYKTVFSMILAPNDAEFEKLKAEAIDKVDKLGVDDVVNWYTDRLAQIHTDLDPLIDKAMTAYKIN